MITCQPDVSDPLIKLSQYSINPAEEDYEAVKYRFKYVKATKSEGTYFWRTQSRDDLIKLTLPTVITSNYTVDIKHNDTMTLPKLIVVLTLTGQVTAYIDALF